MFDSISFLEIIVIAVVALLVLGPDKLPVAIRTVSLWVGRLKRSFNNIRTEIEREVGADEIRRQLRNEAIMEKIKNTKGQFTETIQSVKKEAESVKESVDLKKELSPFSNKKDAADTTTSEPSNTPGLDTSDTGGSAAADDSDKSSAPEK